MKSSARYKVWTWVWKLSICLFLPVFIFHPWHVFEFWIHSTAQFAFATLVQFFLYKWRVSQQLSYLIDSFFCFFHLWAWIDISVLVMRRRRAVWSGPFTFRLRPQLISSWFKGHRVGRKRREDTELTWATAPFLSFPDALIEAEHLKTLHYAQSHIYV